MAKFSKEICDCLIENYGKGVPLKYCADAAGIHRNTVTNWMNKGEKAKSGKYHDFYLEMQRAKSKFISKNMQDIYDNKDWRAKQYLLQVTDSEQFVVQEKQEIRADVNANLELLQRLERPLPELEEDDE